MLRPVLPVLLVLPVLDDDLRLFLLRSTGLSSKLSSTVAIDGERHCHIIYRPVRVYVQGATMKVWTAIGHSVIINHGWGIRGVLGVYAGVCVDVCP